MAYGSRDSSPRSGGLIAWASGDGGTSWRENMAEQTMHLKRQEAEMRQEGARVPQSS
jgi:hypothetical protein